MYFSVFKNLKSKDMRINYTCAINNIGTILYFTNWNIIKIDNIGKASLKKRTSCVPCGFFFFLTNRNLSYDIFMRGGGEWWLMRIYTQWLFFIKKYILLQCSHDFMVYAKCLYFLAVFYPYSLWAHLLRYSLILWSVCPSMSCVNPQHFPVYKFPTMPSLMID